MTFINDIEPSGQKKNVSNIYKTSLQRLWRRRTTLSQPTPFPADLLALN